MGILSSRLSPPKLPSLPPSKCVGGKVLLITDADTGLGREAARHALNLAATVILGVRSATQGEKTEAEISQGVQAFASRVR
ncbi:uncharacterized protein DSM5745_06191 [Aspergillus mulundensis]|uniref:Uncharacterized protein n=1 Tax=Aspergillus mulundensis TaxID=1810919 RepID=A0A3D8RZ54_9EURO|nr:hypothetical protein DSM5745_06191 [Aspergillus mulundensis]RDW79339.1 hypothetical protein DSM5745_06191 [Aspergillus mulundensis]